MSPEETAVFGRLPERIRCWRGGGRQQVLLGVSWSLSRAVAERFARYCCCTRRAMFGLGADDPVVVSAAVEKSRVFAVKLDRSEREIVILPGGARVEWVQPFT
jgi:hypothetical protein